MTHDRSPDDVAAEKTGRELWREAEGDYYSPSLYVAKNGSIGMTVDGTCIFKPIRDWHALATPVDQGEHDGFAPCPTCNQYSHSIGSASTPEGERP